MALPTSGEISIADILNEMGRVNSIISLDELALLWYNRTRKIKFNTLTHRLSDWYGESWTTYGYGYIKRDAKTTKGQIKFNKAIGDL